MQSCIDLFLFSKKKKSSKGITPSRIQKWIQKWICAKKSKSKKEWLQLSRIILTHGICCSFCSEAVSSFVLLHNWRQQTNKILWKIASSFQNTFYYAFFPCYLWTHWEEVKSADLIIKKVNHISCKVSSIFFQMVPYQTKLICTDVAITTN